MMTIKKIWDKIKGAFVRVKALALSHKVVSLCCLAGLLAVISVSVVLPIVILSASSYDKNRERFFQYAFEMIDIRQISTEQYGFSVALPGGRTEGVEFYFSSRDVMNEESKIASPTFSDGLYHFTVEKGFGDYFLWATSAAGTTSMQITIPKAEPFVVQTEKDGMQVNSIHFEIDPDISWSGFIDPKGKNVYRSAKTVFDESARAVSLNLVIERDNETVDQTPNISEPYYYTVFEGKNGVVRYVSYPIRYTATEFTATPSVQLSKSMLRVQATKRDASEQYALKVRGKDAFGKVIYQNTAQDMSLESSRIDISIDISNLPIAETWFDINIVSLATGQSFGIFSSQNGAAIDADTGKRFRFEHFEGMIKVAFSPYTSEVVVSGYTLAELKDEGESYPALTLTGEFLSGTLTAEDIRLVIDYDSAREKVFVASVVAQSEDNGFSVTFNLSKLNSLEVWHNLYIQVEGINYGILEVGNLDQTLSFNGREYALHEHKGYLKINYLNEPS